MKTSVRTFAIGAASLAAAVAIGVGTASAQMPECTFGPDGAPTNYPCTPPAGFVPPGGGTAPSAPGGTAPSAPGGTAPGGTAPGGTAPGGGAMLPSLPPCAPGVLPSPAAPCMFDSKGLPDCEEGAAPSPEAPCKPAGQAPQFSARPPAEALKKLMTLDVEVEGSGEDPGTFDVTLVSIKKGIGKKSRAMLQEELEGESFIIDATKAKCFADKKSDADAIPDKVSCKVLSDETDDSAVTLRATVQVRMKFDATTREPTFIAKKFVIRGKSKI